MTSEEQKAAEQDRLAQEERLAQQDRWSDAAIDREPVIGSRGISRLRWAGLVALALLLLITLPPLINVSRAQRRVASSISGSIGRPVRFDNITLHMLPWPGFTIENFVVYEDPSFGAEPAMRANRVQARVRLSSLWRRRVEVSRITLESPTVNLVRNAAGYWNMQGVVTQAAQVQSAPTAQPKAGDAPRFPYIEGSDARVNVKLDQTKLPYALVDAEFSLWLPSEQEWHLRMTGRPLRSDTDASDVGQLRVDATLSRRGANTAQAPFTLQASWKPTPLGEASKLLVGRDAGWRGTASAEIELHGTPGAMRVTTDMHVHSLRRAEFVPPETLELDAHCEGDAFGLGRQLAGVHCTLPTRADASLLDRLSFGRGNTAASANDVLRLDAEVPDTLDLRTAKASVKLPAASPEWGLRWMRMMSRRVPPTVRFGGTFSLMGEKPGETSGGTDPAMAWSGAISCHCMLPVQDPSMSARNAGQMQHWAVMLHRDGDEGARPDEVALVAMPDAPAPGPETGPEILSSHAADAVTGRMSMDGLRLEWGSAALARAFATVVPALADNMPIGLAGSVVAERQWGATQTWASAAPAAPAGRRKRSRR